MDAIKEWAIMLCVVSVGCAFVAFLIPDGNIKKTANMVINLFLLSVVILPIFSENIFSFPDISMESFPDEDDYLKDFNDYYISSGELVIRQQIKDVLAGICADDFSVNVVVNNDQEGNFVVSEIHIFLNNSDSDKIEIIKNKVGKITGLIPEVIVKNGDSESD